MVHTINISVFSPGTNNLYDFSIPSNMCVRNAVNLIVKILSEEFIGIEDNGRLKHSLLKASTGEMLNETLSLSQLGVSNGEKLILI